MEDKDLKEQQRALAEAVREESRVTASTTVNAELEGTIISVCLRSDDAFQMARAALSVKDFHATDTRSIWEVMTNLYERGIDRNLVTIASELAARDALKKIGGKEKLDALAGKHEGKPKEMPAYCDHLRGFTVAREMIRASTKLSAAAKVQMDSGDRVRAAKAIFDALADLLPRKDGLSNLQATLDRIGINKFCNPLQGTSFIKTPWASLNEILIGYRPGTMNMLGARPSQGKTALAGCISIGAVSVGIPVAVFAYEMTKESMFLRCVCNLAGVDNFRAQKGELTAAEMQQLSDAILDFLPLPLFITDKGHNRVTEAVAEIRRLRNEGFPPGLAVFDHGQLMKPSKPYRDRREAFTEISNDLKTASKEENMAFLVLSQLRRPEKKNQGSRPTIDEMMETGAWEADADTAAVIHRPHFYKSNGDRALVELDLQKHREGPTGMIGLRAEDKYFRFVERELDEDPD